MIAMVAVMMMMGTASAAVITVTDVTPVDSTAGATSDYSAGFTTATGEATDVTFDFSAFGITTDDMDLSSVSTSIGDYTFGGFTADPTGVIVDNAAKTVEFTGGTTTAAGAHTIDNAVSGTGWKIINDKGAATQDVTISTASDSGTASVTIAPGAATKLVFTVEPAGSVSGVALTTQPVVQAQDA